VILGEQLCRIRYWLSDNKLLLHLGKTESILFWTKSKLYKAPKLSIKYHIEPLLIILDVFWTMILVVQV